jgi:hypothetical protein
MTMQAIKRKLMTMGLLLPLANVIGLGRASAMGQRPQRPSLTPAQQRLQNMGLALVVDAVEGAEMLGVEFFADDNENPFYAKSRMVRRNREIMAFPSGTVPEQVRVLWRGEKDDNWPRWWSDLDAVDDFGRRLPDFPALRRDPNFKSLGQQERLDKRKRIAQNTGYKHQGPWGSGYFGKVLGDHTIPVASRIPDEVVAEIRKNGGGLRLKFRLHPEGVFFGWDVERLIGGLPRHSMAGGDFREAGLAYELPGRLVYDAYLNPYTASARLNPEAKPYLDSGDYFIPPNSSTIWRRGWYMDKFGHKVLADY